MIVRVLGEGRYEVPDSGLAAIESLDSQLVEALDKDDDAAFSSVLAQLITEVRRSGKLLDPDDLRTSDQAVPHEGSTLAEVKQLLAEDS